MATEQARISNWHNELVPNIVDRLASLTPTAPYALYPRSPWSYDEGYRTVTYKDFANAINGLAWWLHETLGVGKNFEVLAYIGPNDVRYTALVLGAVKAGYLAFLTSPRNSIPAHVGMFNKLNCQTLLSSNPTPPAVDLILSAHDMRHFHVPSVAELLEKSYPPYPYNKAYETACWEPLWVIHTSGSTGIPKPLIWTHETAARNINFLAKDPPPGTQSLNRLSQGKRVINTFPPFHGACLISHLFNSIPFGAVMIAPLSGAIPTAEGAVEALKRAPAEIAFLVPSIVSELSQDPALLEYCSKHLEMILYAGGDLPKEIGDKVASKVPLKCQYGASEIGITSQLLPSNMKESDWRYIQYHPCLGLHFEEITDGIHEMVVKRDSTKEETQSTFTIAPTLNSLQEYRTSDLFQRHPSIPDLWCWRARADDIIVFLNGEKTNPVPMEQHVMARNQDVAAALVVGMQRFQAALLVEPVTKLGGLSTSEEAAFIEKIWPNIEEANQDAPAHARIEKSMILVTSPEKPMVRAGKGTIQRQASIAQYTEEIEALYKNADMALGEPSVAPVDSHDADEVSRFIEHAISTINPGLRHEDTNNFFALGMDSLQAMRLTRTLRQGLHQRNLALSTIYNNPSIPQLTQYIVNRQSEDNGQDGLSTRSEQAILEKMLTEYEQLIGQIPVQSRTTTAAGTSEVVVLTGSTGSLGTYLLHVLLANPAVSHVYCLDRKKDAQAIHQRKSNATGLSLGKHSKKVTFLQASLNKPNLGLDETTYETLQSKTTHIIHNAWPVNFNLSLPAFRPQLDGLVNLFRLSALSSCPPKMLFISSISAVASLFHDPKRVPEALVRSFDAPFDIGYAKSKLISELLCDSAARHLHIPISFARVGQIAGPVQSPGLWSPMEWLPSLIISSIHLGALPNDLGAGFNKIDWMPVDILAEAIVQLVSGKEDRSTTSATNGDMVKSAEVFNILNPQPTTWTRLLPSIVSSLEKYLARPIDIIPSSEWLAKVHRSAEAMNLDHVTAPSNSRNSPASAPRENLIEAMVRANPAVKLLDFYRKRMTDRDSPGGWEIDRALARSIALRNMPSVGSDWVEIWIKGWIAGSSRVKAQLV